MRKALLFALLFLSAVSFSQAPQYLNYQAVARDASGNIITTAIGIKFEILQGSSIGTLVYAETNNITPSSVGVFTTAIGSGAASVGTFSLINWANSPYFLRVSIDPAGGTSYSTVGTSQLLSVPYALYAEKAGNTQTVNITGSGVTGTYPNYTINPATLTPSTGISITGGTITNTAPNPTLTPSGITSITGTHPSFTIDVPPPSLNYNTGTNVLTLTQGTSVATTTLVGAGSNTVAMTAQGIASVNPVGAGSSFTVSVPPPTFTNVGATTITGSYPNFTVNSPGASTVTPANLQINAPHSTSTLSANNYSINIVPTSITGSGVSGAYPNYTVNAAASPTIQINSPNTANTVALNNYSITVPNTSLTAAGIASVSGVHPAYTLTVPGPSLSITGNTISISQGTVVSTKTISSSPWSYGAGVLFPANNPFSDKVGIGQSSASSLLDISNGTASSVTISPVVSIANSNTGFAGSSLLYAKNTAGTGAGVIVDQFTNGDGVDINVNGASSNGNALQVNHNGIGNASFFSINNVSSNARVIDATQSGLGDGMKISMTNTASSAMGLYVTSSGTGPGMYVYKSSPGYAFYASSTATNAPVGYFGSGNAANSQPALNVSTNSTLAAGAVISASLGTGIEVYSGSSNYSGFFSNSSTGVGNAIKGVNVGTSPTILADNLGTGKAFNATNSSSVAETGFFGNSGLGRALIVQNPGASTVRAAFINGGLDIMGKTSSSSTFPLIVTNVGSTNLFNVRDDGNVGVGNPSPNNRLSVYEPSSSSAAIFSQQNSAASSAGAHGVYGLTSNANPLAAGIYGDNSGAGPAVFGYKSTSSGVAGRFEIPNTTNTADALFANTSGGGAAIHAVNGPTVSGGSNIGLWLDAGHLKSTQLTAPTVNTISVSGGGISSATISLSAGSTDVKGTLQAVITTTGIVNQNNNFVVRVNFNKPYTNPPVVVMTPASDNGVLQPFISAVSLTSFTVTFKNPTTTNMSALSPFSVNYNYMVIE